MSNIVYKYRIFCESENIHVTCWDKVPPTTCPNNNNHMINGNSITVLEQLSDQNVSIIQTVPGFTNGFYKVEGWSCVIPANSSAYKDISWPYNIAIMTMNLYPSSDNIGDTINGYAGPDTIIGINTETLNQNVSVINVNSTVIDNIKNGYTVHVVNSTQNINMGECISIDLENSRITCNTTSSESIVPGAYIKVSRHIIKNMTFTTNNNINLANKNVFSTAFAANTVARMTYTNNSNTQKTFYYSAEYEY